MKRTALIAAGLGLTVNAHLFISSPQPIEGSAPKSPLDASGSNFPCHGVNLPTSGGQPMAAGSNQTLAFDTGNGANTAVHGGGSCQLSLTYETDPAKVKDPKNWHVIYSIEGGCPSNTFQNLDGNYKGPQGSYTGSWPCGDPKTNGVDCVNSFDFSIPKGVKDGHAILAWTWFNNVGNREMYMNCVNTELSGGDGSEMDSFPSMFVANLANVDSCPTTQSVELLFPNPGKYVTTKTAAGEAAKTAKTFPAATPTGPGCAGDGGAASSGSSPSYGQSPSSAQAAPSKAPAASDSAVASASQPVNTNTGVATVTTMKTVTGSAGAATTSRAQSSGSYGGSALGGSGRSNGNPSSNDAVSSIGAGTSTGAGSFDGAGSSTIDNGPTGTTTSGSGSCSNGAVSCSSLGSVVCIGSNQWGICDTNNCAVPQVLAAGTKCSGGAIVAARRVKKRFISRFKD